MQFLFSGSRKIKGKFRLKETEIKVLRLYRIEIYRYQLFMTSLTRVLVRWMGCTSFHLSFRMQLKCVM